MKPPAAIDLAALEARLGGPVPLEYAAYVRSMAGPALSERGFDPKTLLILTLERRNHDHDGSTQGKLFLNGDGCGNYHFVELERDATAVRLWAHDPPGIEDHGQRLGVHLQEATQDCRVDRPLDRRSLCIARTSAYKESVLEPITLDEWVAAVSAYDGGEHLGYREGKNPFTKEVVRFRTPGRARVTVAGKAHFMSWFHGRIELHDHAAIRAVAQALAKTLGAGVITRDGLLPGA